MAPTHGKLVIRVKTMQRVGATRQAWEDYCKEHLGGLCDPNRHDAKTLMAYLEYMEVDVSDDDDDDDIDNDDPHQHESMVWRVKEFQRGGPSQKQAWETFCDTKMGGVKDPSRHESSSMLKFLKVNENGAYGGKIKKSSKEKGHIRGGRGGEKTSGGGEKTSSGGKSDNVQFIRTGQRCSASFKKAWKAYCKQHHDGDTDPTMFEEGDLSYFTDYVGQVLLSALGVDSGAAGDIADGDKESEAPAAKKRPLATDNDSSATKAPRMAEQDAPQEAAPLDKPEKKKVTMKKSVADEIRRINASGVFESQIKLGAVAEPLSRLDEATALAVLQGVEAAEGVADPTATIVASVEATLNPEEEEEAES